MLCRSHWHQTSLCGLIQDAICIQLEVHGTEYKFIFQAISSVIWVFWQLAVEYITHHCLASEYGQQHTEGSSLVFPVVGSLYPATPLQFYWKLHAHFVEADCLSYQPTTHITKFSWPVICHHSMSASRWLLSINPVDSSQITQVFGETPNNCPMRTKYIWVSIYRLILTTLSSSWFF